MTRTISEIELKFGSSPQSERLKFSPDSITIFVGPNNSGKSRLISDLSSICLGRRDEAPVILENATFAGFSEKTAKDIIRRVTIATPRGNAEHEGMIYVGNEQDYALLPTSDILNALTNPNNKNLSLFARSYMSRSTLVLTGTSRIKLINDQPSGDLQSEPHTTFQKLFKNDRIRKNLSDVVRRSLGFHVTMDPTGMSTLGSGPIDHLLAA